MATRRYGAYPIRFSLKALFLLILLVALCLGSWEATKRFAENERTEQLVDTYALAPFIIYRDKYPEATRRYYIWLFGPTVELPYHSPLSPSDNAGTFP